MSDGQPTSWVSSPKYMYQRIRVTSQGMVLKKVNPGIIYQFYFNPKNNRDCRNWPCKSTQDCIVSLVSTLGFPYATAPCTHPDRFRRFWSGGVSFFVRLVKMMRAFINETTARLWCARVFVKLGYVSICCLPRMAIMRDHERGSKDIFRPHTEASACWRCAFFIPWTAGVNIFRAYVKADFVTSTPLCGLPMGTPWLLVRRDLSK
jgi:hypothetical protein